MRTLIMTLAAAACAVSGQSLVNPNPATYCNPLDLNYAYRAADPSVGAPPHRTSADPVIVPFDGAYYLFATRVGGYWRSKDLASWTLIERSFLDDRHAGKEDVVAPAAWVQGGALHVMGSSYTRDYPIWRSTDPASNVWEVATRSFDAGEPGSWDPSFLEDDDGRLFMVHGSSNTLPIWGMEIDPDTFDPIGERTVLMDLDPDRHGWERFGEANDNTFLAPFIEGGHWNKHAGKYVLQYAAPGTEFLGYGDGIATSEHPLGPYERQAHNPFAYKPGGFVVGAGHGAMFKGHDDAWWHVGTMRVSVKQQMERRLGLWPVSVDADGGFWCNTAYGDYPHRAADGAFTGWMLLNAQKPVRVSSTHGGHRANFAVDEEIRTYWSAATDDAGEWIESDLGELCAVRAIQINHADQDAKLDRRTPGIEHRYTLEGSIDGDAWFIIADRSAGHRDAPHDYIELTEPVQARFIRLTNAAVPTGKFAISGLRVFGRGGGESPAPVSRMVVLRGHSEPRNAWIRWPASDRATGYVVYAGLSQGAMHTACTVNGATEFYFRAMDRDRDYWFAIEAFNENGISQRTEPLLAGVPSPLSAE